MKYSVISMSLDGNGVCNFIQCIGVYEDHLKAYGKMILHANELAADCDDPAALSLLFELEASTGFGISVTNKDREEIYQVYVLWSDNSSSREEIEGDDARGRT